MNNICLPQEKVIKVTVPSPSYEDCLKIAEESNKKIFLLFYGEYCGPCNKMKEELMKPEVLSILDANYVVCYVDLVEQKALAKKYKVRSVPNFFIIDHNEKIIKNDSGFKDANYMAKWMTKSVLIRD
jgi:thioredoxin-related protein